MTSPRSALIGVDRGSHRGGRGPAFAIAVATGALRLGKSVDSSPLPGSWHNSVVSPRVLTRLLSPDKATISDIRTELSALESDGRDYSR